MLTGNGQFLCLFSKFSVQYDRCDTACVLSMLVRLHTAVCGEFHIRMFQNIVFEVFDRSLTAYKKKCVAVVQHTHFIRCHQLSACDLPVDRVAAVSTFGLSIGVRINRFLAEQLGHIFMRRLLVTAEIQELITVAHDAFPLFFE